MGIQIPKLEPRHLRPLRQEPGDDGHLPCPLDARPTDDEAKAAGFQNGSEWYSYSTSGDLKDPALVKQNFESLLLPKPAIDEGEDDLPSIVDEPTTLENWT